MHILICSRFGINIYLVELFYAHDVALGVYGIIIIIIILSKANKKKESKAGGASGSKSAESSPSSLKKEQTATAASKKVCHYACYFYWFHANTYRVPATANCRGLQVFLWLKAHLLLHRYNISNNGKCIVLYL